MILTVVLWALVVEHLEHLCMSLLCALYQAASTQGVRAEPLLALLLEG